uniref:Kinesin-like protein n=1 Tax=Strigops habroptila TaxID=2489341 RepID=A0A672UGK5_STRHB
MVLCPPPEEGTVAVVVRVRPLAPCECERAVHPVLHVVGQHVIVLNPEEPGGPPGSLLPLRGPKQQGKELKFVFDRVFGEEATQEEVFQHTTSEVLDSVLNGYNCSVFAYGATGAGKTYTMLGSEHSPGIMYFTMVELYKRIEARKEEKSCEVLISYQEVYNEQIYDLLEPKGPLAIREDPERGVVVQGLSFHQPASAEQLLEMLANGNKNRTQHPTDANAASSRSHAIFQIYVKQQDRVGSLTRDLKVAKMSLIDLAGSERASVANTRGERLREGANINRSLLALINVINALADAKSKKSHIPYRDSKLTRLLKDSIGGNCRTVMVAAVSPSMLAYEDTYNTLKYASRAKEIKLSVRSSCHGDVLCVWELLVDGKELAARWCLRGAAGAAEPLLLVTLAQGHLSVPRPAAAILSAIQKLYSILKAANLLTPGVVSVLEELEHLVPRDAGVSPERGGCPELWGFLVAADRGDCFFPAPLAEASVTMPIAPVTSATLQCLQQPAPFFSHGPMASSPNKRRKSQLDSASPSGRPCSVKRQMKRQQGCGKAAEIPRTQSPGTPWLEAEAQTPPGSPVPPCYTRKTCPAAVTKSRVPLATSAAQNRCSLPAHDLNVTFEVCEESRAPSTIEPWKVSLPVAGVGTGGALRSLQPKPVRDLLFEPLSLTKPGRAGGQDPSPGTNPLFLGYRAPIPMLAMKNSSLPKASVLKRRRVER